MKFNVAMLSLVIMLSLFLFGILRIRNKEHQKAAKQKRFQDIKLRVSHDMLGDYQEEIRKFTTLLKNTEEEIKALEPEMIKSENIQNQKKMDMDGCTGAKKEIDDQLALLELEMKTLNTESQKTIMAKEVASLTQQMSQRSKVCDYIQKDSDNARKLCGEDVSKKVESNAEAPKPVEAKAEAPKAEAPKAEAPKAEAPKAEAPKAEAPKAEAPKAEAPKAEAPKAEAPKAEAPKAEAPKAEAPKPVEAKADVANRR